MVIGEINPEGGDSVGVSRVEGVTCFQRLGGVTCFQRLYVLRISGVGGVTCLQGLGALRVSRVRCVTCFQSRRCYREGFRVLSVHIVIVVIQCGFVSHYLAPPPKTSDKMLIVNKRFNPFWNSI